MVNDTVQDIKNTIRDTIKDTSKIKDFQDQTKIFQKNYLGFCNVGVILFSGKEFFYKKSFISVLVYKAFLLYYTITCEAMILTFDLIKI